MADFQVDLNQLVTASAAWGDAGDKLGQAATRAQTIHDSHNEVVWGIFGPAWSTQVAAAAYLHDRLTEASNEAHAIRDVLVHVAKVYGAHDQDFAEAIKKLQAGM
ncbi:hypothetical protein [Nocardia miyunensis]|uniref:hypothetical protein n=1 Tax=Nocardia miyunensis TaxID=282684 RepID=UPI00082A8C62|nr:hypothetical protein [Nocardia miyunensis]